MTDHNRAPEQRARGAIDTKLVEAGWRVQSMRKIDFSAGAGIAVREYQTDVGPADYMLFIDHKPVGVIEAKPEDWGQKITAVEEQSTGYADATLKWLNSAEPRPFVYESTGTLTRFTDRRDPKPRSREVFSFHRPDTMQEWLAQPGSLRARLQGLPDLDPTGLRGCQIAAVECLEASFKRNHPRALMQMATGSGKTYTAITAVYRLLKYADAKRILFLVDTRNLGEQAHQEFMAYVPSDDNRKFVELYNVQRLNSSFVAGDSQVCISTIQRMYSILKGEEMAAHRALEKQQQWGRTALPDQGSHRQERPAGHRRHLGTAPGDRLEADPSGGLLPAQQPDRLGRRGDVAQLHHAHRSGSGVSFPQVGTGVATDLSPEAGTLQRASFHHRAGLPVGAGDPPATA